MLLIAKDLVLTKSFSTSLNGSLLSSGYPASFNCLILNLDSFQQPLKLDISLSDSSFRIWSCSFFTLGSCLLVKSNAIWENVELSNSKSSNGCSIPNLTWTEWDYLCEWSINHFSLFTQTFTCWLTTTSKLSLSKRLIEDASCLI